jgi:hypothetical protein
MRLELEFVPVRVVRHDGPQDFQQFFTACVQRPQLHFAIVGHDLQGRARGCDIPARVPPGIFISRGKVNATVPIEIAQKMFQASAKVGLGYGASDFDPVRSLIAVFAHG